MWPMPLRNVAHEPQAVWEALKAGNQRVLDGETVDVREIYNREGLTHGQDPRVVVISCSDSRAPIEHVFNIGFGDAFVIRTAGHILDDAVLASLDYALAALKPNLLVVLGHQSCGAVGAATGFVAGGELPTLQPWHVAENKWRGARYGLEAEIITSRATDEALVTDELFSLVDALLPTATSLGCEKELQLVPEIIERGAGYQRQRDIFKATGDWRAVVDATCREMDELTW